VAFFGVFIAYPFIRSIYLSLTNWTGMGAEHFIGFSNFTALFQDPIFLTALRNTVVYTVVTTVLQTFLPMVVAAVLARGWVGSAIFRTAMFIPAVMSLVITGTLFGLVLNPDFGLLNRIIGFSGLGDISWLSDSATVLPTLIAVSLWQSYGLFMVIFYAGVRGIDRELYEAAALDGANVVQEFWHVTMPMLRVLTSVVVTINIINGVRVFDLIYVMTEGGPAHASESLGTYLYGLAFGQTGGSTPLIGYATTIGVVIVIFALFAVALQLAMARRRRIFE
jgi:ABC-type sugar transport system permease subunit